MKHILTAYLMTPQTLSNFTVNPDYPYPMSFGHESRDLNVECIAYLDDYIATIATLDNG